MYCTKLNFFYLFLKEMTCPIKSIQGKPPMCKPPPLIRKNRGQQLYQNVLDAYGEEYKEKYSTANKYYDRFSDDNYKLNIKEPYPKQYGLYEPY
jgi:hypothetical protein